VLKLFWRVKVLIWEHDFARYAVICFFQGRGESRAASKRFERLCTGVAERDRPFQL
jgi:hypothetical protein